MVNGSDLTALRSLFYTDISLFGCKKEYEEEFLRRCKLVGDALMEEQGVTDCKAAKFSNTLIFGEKATAAYRELEAWVKMIMGIK